MSTRDCFDSAYFLTYCQSLYDTDKAYDVKQADRLNRHRHLEPDSAQFLANIATLRKPNKVLEIGTSTGFSTLWLAYGLRHHSHVDLISLDIDESRSDIAKAHLQNTGLAAGISLRVQDALDFLNKTDDIFELIFLDAERQFYHHYLKGLHQVLSVGSVLIVDNVISHCDDVGEFLAAFKNDPRYICHTLDIGAGLFMAVRQEL